ncbi:hypothetical protein BC629DRAFT_1537029 [Irpex lacteus]|nr:hypothetical protein BC629DRAFT_1537029 [Irpex lacteus]
MTDYDETLLASAPSISRKQKQESYNIALLHPTPPSPIESAPLTSYRPSSPRATHPSKETYYPGQSSTRQPWYRNKKVWIVGGVGLVVGGAIVGGAVGGTVGRHGENQSALAGDGAGSSTGGVDVLPSASAPQPLPTPTATPTTLLSTGSPTTFEPPPTGTDTRGVSPSSTGGGGQPIDISTSSPGDSDTAFPSDTATDGGGGGGVRPSDSGVGSGVPVGDPTATSTHRSHTRNTMFRGTVGGTPTATPEGGDPIQGDPVQTDV